MENKDIITTLPELPGIRFRHFEGERDYPAMVELWSAMCAAGFGEGAYTVEDMRIDYRHLSNCDPFRDLLIAEQGGKIIAYARAFWEQVGSQKVFYQLINRLPGKTSLSVSEALLGWLEARQKEIALEMTDSGAHIFAQSCDQSDRERCAMLENAGYSAVRWFFSMSRDLEQIPDVDLPEGLEIRPALPGEYHRVWERGNEAFREHWGYVEQREEDYQNWKEGRWFQPMLWQVAWDGGEPVGQVNNFIDMLENENTGKLRGYTEGISVLKPYRGKGLARALIARSLRMLRAMNLQEAALTVDAGNASGALKLYENMGYRTYRTMVEWHKAMPAM